jgi:DNA-binding PadR family transcriptional regulator
LKYIILDLIKDKPRYGYEIIRALEELSHGLYKPSAGAVYPILRTLEKMGYVFVAVKDGKKVYTITDDGIRFLTEQSDFTEEIKGHIKGQWNPENMGEIAKTMEAVSKFKNLFDRRLEQMDTVRMRRIRKIISRAHEDIDEIMREKKKSA